MVDNYNKFSLPLDALWTDIDYMISNKDFTIDTQRFPIPEMQKLFNRSTDYGVHWVIPNL